MPASSSLLSFQCALVTGGAGGIGKAIAQYLLAQGKKVIIVGRTESKLRNTAQEIGATAYYVLDTGKTSDIGAFAQKVIQDHPDFDCLINNAGVQRPIEVIKDQDFLEKADQEIDINIRGPMHLTLTFLPHLQKQSHPVVMNVSSLLGFIPFSIINPVYNGTKAWLHFWTMNLRTQLRQGESPVKVVEIAPPMVESDLHREREDPDDNKKSRNPIAMSMEEFMDDVKKGLENGEEMIAPGMAGEPVSKWYEHFGKKAEGN